MMKSLSNNHVLYNGVVLGVHMCVLAVVVQYYSATLCHQIIQGINLYVQVYVINGMLWYVLWLVGKWYVMVGSGML